jgi:hypothetical protein
MMMLIIIVVTEPTLMMKTQQHGHHSAITMPDLTLPRTTSKPSKKATRSFSVAL